MAAATASAPSGAAKPEPTINLGSPRVRAAMKVLGTLPSELRKLDPAQFQGDEAKLKLWEQKRRNLIEEVNLMATRGAQAHGGHKGDASAARAEANAAFLREVERAEKENMERLQRMAKKDVQKAVIQELEAKVTAVKGQKKQEESHARLRDLLKVRDDKLALQKKQALKKQERNQDVRDKAMRAKAETAAQIAEALRKGNERAEGKMAAAAAEHQEHRVKTAEKRELIFHRQENYENDLLHKREVAYHEHCVKHQAKLDMLAERLQERQSCAEAIAKKQRECLENVAQHQKEKQAEVEKKFFEICERHATAAKTREDNLAIRVKKFQVTNSKRRSQHETRYSKLLEELEHKQASSLPGSPGSAHDRGLFKRDSPRSATMPNGFGRSSSDSKLLEVLDHRRHLDEIVHGNLQRLRRAHHYAVEQQIEKLDTMRKKVQVMQDAKHEADRRRMVVMRNVAVAKMHLEERVNRIKDSSNPEKMNQMLEDLDVGEPDSPTRCPKNCKCSKCRINELLGAMGMEKLGGAREEGTEEAR